MKSALDVLSLYKEKCDTLIAVLGDMFEIGQNADAYHKEVGSYAKRVGVDWLLSVGDKSRYYNLGAEEAGLEKGKSMHFKDKLELADFLNKLLDHKAAVLIKGSRGMKMEMILEKLEQKGN
jgi:UDP-N-acetylmuramoyl-tripeptide--D-alanyl-D-alanine ligase